MKLFAFMGPKWVYSIWKYFFVVYMLKMFAEEELSSLLRFFSLNCSEFHSKLIVFKCSLLVLRHLLVFKRLWICFDQVWRCVVLRYKIVFFHQQLQKTALLLKVFLPDFLLNFIFNRVFILYSLIWSRRYSFLQLIIFY